MLEKDFLGNSLENWGISLIIILGTILLTKLVSLFNRKFIRSFTQKTRNQLDDILYESMESPIVFGIALIGYG